MRKTISQRFPKTSAFLSKTNTKVSNFSDWFMPPQYDRLAYGFAGIRDAPLQKPNPTRLPQKERTLSKEEQTRKELQGPVLNGADGSPIPQPKPDPPSRGEEIRQLKNLISSEEHYLSVSGRKIHEEAIKAYREQLNQLEGSSSQYSPSSSSSKNRYEVECKEREEKFKQRMKEYEDREVKEMNIHRDICAMHGANSEHERKKLVSSLYNNLTGWPSVLSLYSRYRKDLDLWFSNEQKREIRDRISDDSKMRLPEKIRCLPKIGIGIFGLRYVRLFFRHLKHNDDFAAAVVIPTVFIVGITGAIFGVREINRIRDENAEKPVKPKSETTRSYEAESNSGKIAQPEPLPEIPMGQSAKTTARAHFDRGVAYYNLEEYEKAITEFTRAMNLDRVRSEYFFWRADAYDKVGRYGAARIDRRTGDQWRSVLGRGF